MYLYYINDEFSRNALLVDRLVSNKTYLNIFSFGRVYAATTAVVGVFWLSLSYLCHCHGIRATSTWRPFKDVQVKHVQVIVEHKISKKVAVEN